VSNHRRLLSFRAVAGDIRRKVAGGQLDFAAADPLISLTTVLLFRPRPA